MDPEITKDEKFVDWVTGNKVLEGSVPLAHRLVKFTFCNIFLVMLLRGEGHYIGL